MASLKTALYRYIRPNLEDNSINYDGYEAVVGGNWKCHKNIGISVMNAKLGGDLKNILNNRYPKI